MKSDMLFDEKCQSRSAYTRTADFELELEFYGLENSTCAPKPCTVMNTFTEGKAISRAMALPRRRMAVYSLTRPRELRMLLAVGRVGIEAAGP